MDNSEYYWNTTSICRYTVHDNLDVKEVIIGDGEARVRYVLVRNPIEARLDATRREKLLEKLKEELSKLKELNGTAHTKAHYRLNNHLTYKKYLKMDSKGNLKINNQVVKEMEHLDGKYLIRTSDDTLSVENIASVPLFRSIIQASVR